MVILSKGQKDINRITVNHTPLSNFTNIQGLSSNFAECESFVESNFPDILALCEKNLNDSIDSDNFSLRGYLPLICYSYAWIKDSGRFLLLTCMVLQYHVEQVLHFISRKLCRFLLMFLIGFT